MKKLLTAALIALPFVLGTAYAADAPTKRTKLGACSKEAKEKGLKGDERNAFLSECNKKQADARKAQQEKMAACSKENKGKKGDEYKKAQKECLSK
jgi:hypothetical protein